MGSLDVIELKSRVGSLDVIELGAEWGVLM